MGKNPRSTSNPDRTVNNNIGTDVNSVVNVGVRGNNGCRMDRHAGHGWYQILCGSVAMGKRANTAYLWRARLLIVVLRGRKVCLLARDVIRITRPRTPVKCPAAL